MPANSLGSQLQLELLADDTRQKPRTECCCESVARSIASIVASPADCELTMITALNECVTVTENGVVRQIAKFEATCEQIANKAATGHMPENNVPLPLLTAAGGR